jgi:hypothetical protein
VLVIALACAGLVVSAMADYDQEKSQAQQLRQPKANLTKEEAAFVQEARMDTKAVSGTGQKLCSVIVPGNWRDTINAPPGSTLSSCIRFMNITIASTLQLGCIFPDGSVSLGPNGGGAPSPNCGW